MEDIIDTLLLIKEVKQLLLPVIQCETNAIEQNNIKVWREGSTVKIEIKTK